MSGTVTKLPSNSLFAGVFALLLALLSLPMEAQAQTIDNATHYVDANSTSMAPDGLSWATAFTDIQSAITAAEATMSASVIWIAAGTYTLSAGSNTVAGGGDALNLYGGLTGSESAGYDLDGRDLENSQTVITSTATDAAAFVVTSTDAVRMDGLIIRDVARATGTGAAGLEVTGATPLVLNSVVFDGNSSALGSGGAIQVAAASGAVVTIEESRFQDNSALAGGAVFFADGNPVGSTITNSIFDSNEATAGDGGGVNYADATLGALGLTIAHGTFYNNEASAAGGGVFDAAGSGTVAITNSIFNSNSATTATTESFDIDGASTFNFYETGTITSTAGDSDGIASASPDFVNQSTDDFTLEASSLAINTGTAGTASDFDGATRDAAPDRGAHEMAYSLDYGDLPDGGGPPPDYSAITELPNDAARHLITGPYLGAAVDAELNGVPDAASEGDDNAGTDDEDGAEFSTMFVGGTGSVKLYLSGAASAYANIWIDWDSGTADGDFLDAGDLKLVDQPIQAGDNTIKIPASGVVPAAGTYYARVRVTSSSGTSATTGFAGYMADGEVEDYQVVVEAAPTNVVVGTGNGGASIAYVAATTTLTVTDPNGTVLYSGDPGSGSTTITGSEGNDTFTFNGAVDGNLTLTIDGGTNGTDSIVLSPTTTLSASIDQTYTNETDGSIAMVTTDPFTHTINYQNFDPITDNSDSPTKTFTFASSGTITLNADGDGTADNNYSYIDCDGCGEATTFKNPTGGAPNAVTINAFSGDDTVVLGLLDTSSGTLPTVDVTVNGNSGVDLFTVTPAAGASGYNIDVNGALPSGVCPADGLVIDTSGGAVVSTYGTPPASTVEFSSTHQDIDYTGIESIGDADVSIALSASTLYSTDVLTSSNSFDITVTNAGPTTANCVTVVIDPGLSAFLVGGTATGPGSFNTTTNTWTVGALASGVSQTLSLTGFVATNVDRDITFTAAAVEDTDTDNNVATAAVTIGFLFPSGTQVNSAIYTEQQLTVDGTTYPAFNQLMVGIYQGAPGKDGAVWCKLPTEITDGVTTIWPPAPLTPAAMPDLWRPCATGLPFPLHPNGFYEDTSGTLWLPVWGHAGLYKSDDKGQNWEEAWPGFGAGDPSKPAYWVNVYAITEDAANILYISANNGNVYRSLDSGGIWQALGQLPHSSADTPWSLTAHPSVAGTIYAGLFGKGVYVSTDFGLTWAELDDPATTLATENENDALLDTDLSGDNAGYIFDLKFSPDGNFLFAGTSYGVWRANLTAGPTDFTGTWTFMGPTVTVNAGTVVPEVRSIAFNEQAADGDDDLFIASWGFGAFSNASPSTTTGFSELTLRMENVTFVAVSPDGEITLGSDDGTIATVPSASVTSTASETGADVRAVPTDYALAQNYPNPFNPVTTISFALPETADVRLAVYDVLGRTIAVLVDGVIDAGHHEVQFNATNLPSGTYLYRLEGATNVKTRVLTLMK